MIKLRLFSMTMLMPIAISVVSFSNDANAQLPSQNHVSPINYFGRYHGFGYSDGYHACKNSRPSAWSMWKPWESMSSFYGEPTLPPSSHFRTHGSAAYRPLQTYSNDMTYSQPIPTPNQIPMGQEPITLGPSSIPNHGYELEQPPMSVPQTFAPPSRSVPPAAGSNSYESISPAPPRNQNSPSDKESFELPVPRTGPEREPIQPSAQNRRVPPGMQTLLHPSAYRQR